MPIVYTYVYIQATKTCFFTSQPIGVLRPTETTLSESLILFARGHVEVQPCSFGRQRDVLFRGFVSRLEDDLHIRL
jgi:hypothetical protein